MSRDEEVKNPRLFDSRIVERHIRKGLITRKDYDKHLKALPDVTDKIAPADAPRAAVVASPVSVVSVGAASDDDLDDSDTDEVALDDDDVEEELEAGAEGEDDDEDEDDDDDDDGEVPGGDDKNNAPGA
jgi:hypothetical protein